GARFRDRTRGARLVCPARGDQRLRPEPGAGRRVRRRRLRRADAAPAGPDTRPRGDPERLPRAVSLRRGDQARLDAPASPAARRRGQWWIPTTEGHRRMLEVAGFAIEDTARPFAIPLGPEHRLSRGVSKVRLSTRILQRLLLRDTGMPCAAALARPRIQSG